MKHLTVLCVLMILFFTNCKDDTEERNGAGVEVVDATEKLDTIFSGADINFLNQLRASKYANAQNVPINWSRFRMVTSLHEDSLITSPFQPDSSYFLRYGPLLRYSPDSSMFIDLDSYNTDFQKNRSGKVYPIEHGPDTEVSLVDLEEKQRTRLVFLGPGNGVEDGGWIDSNSVVLVGYHEKDTSKLKKAVIWRYHVPTKTFHVYESPDTSVVGRLLNWRKERFRQLR